MATQGSEANQQSGDNVQRGCTLPVQDELTSTAPESGGSRPAGRCRSQRVIQVSARRVDLVRKSQGTLFPIVSLEMTTGARLCWPCEHQKRRRA